MSLVMTCGLCLAQPSELTMETIEKSVQKSLIARLLDCLRGKKVLSPEAQRTADFRPNIDQW